MFLLSEMLLSSLILAESNTVKIILVIAFILVFIVTSVVSGIMTFKARMKKFENKRNTAETKDNSSDSAGE